MLQRERMTKLGKAVGCSAKEAERVFDIAMDVLVEEILRDGKLRIAGFGTFELHERPARAGRNPRTGELMKIAPKKAVRFHPAMELRQIANNED